ncbi:MAG TPA: ArsR family transcriptional regulator [Candidatus Tectomicrobia bacterium]|nr:ArsR family transcriptional regulator [Candidatus Tectomicrobia bacterium]
MATVERIDPEQARREVAAGALLVCAYDDEQKCNRMRLEGSISLHELQHRTGALRRDQPLIFYCA